MAKYSLIDSLDKKSIDDISCPQLKEKNNTKPTMTEMDISMISIPPIPPRTFKGKIMIPVRTTNINNINLNNNLEERTDLSIAKDISLERSPQRDDEDIGDSEDLFDKNSSDSNRSQTISVNTDTGYVSAFENDRLVTTNQRQFRARFASEDTQSSLDYVSGSLQRADTIDSLQTNFTDSPFSFKKTTNVFNFDRINYKIPSNGSIDSGDSKSITPTRQQFKPAVPARKNLPQTPPRGMFLDSGKLLQNGQILGSFNSVNNDGLQNISPSSLNQSEKANNPNSNFVRTKSKGHSKKIHSTKINQRQDSNISSDSYSMISSPGYNSKNMEVPLLQSTTKLKKSKVIHHQNSSDSMSTPNKMHHKNVHNVQTKVNTRQDSNISSDSFSQTSSPGYNYNSKYMDAPLIVHAVKMHKMYKNTDEIFKDTNNDSNSQVITKSKSSPAGLQTIVRFSNGSNMSLQHKILKARKNSNPYITRGRLKFRLCQIFCNALALLIIAAGLSIYFKTYPTLKFVNQTSTNQQEVLIFKNLESSNPATGICLPVIVKFCQNHKLPYNYTVFPNYIGHFGQIEAQAELDNFDALVDVNCFELVPLYLCSLFVPKCSSIGKPVPPCKALCSETMKRCGFFFDVFGLELPEYLTCKLFSDSENPDECVGGKEVKDLKNQKPVCDDFLCDQKRCLPKKWVCDGHVDCQDQTDELNCKACNNSSAIYCGNGKCMSDKNICDGKLDCPYGQDERNCMRLSKSNGDIGRGTLEVYIPSKKKWQAACIDEKEKLYEHTPSKICTMLGYSAVNSTRFINVSPNVTVQRDLSVLWRSSQKRTKNVLREYSNCGDKTANQSYIELTCQNFECGKIKSKFRRQPQTRIIGGKQSSPGDWPFLAAILGGPEEIFYCAGVLLSDQWVLTASHCIGNHTLRNLQDWTIQLGMTRRHSYSYYSQRLKVKSVIPHPQYNFYVAHDNDIALFQLATRVAFHEHLLPACLPPDMDKELKPGTACHVIGWGRSEDKNSSPNARHSYEPVINEVVVPILNRDLCNEWLDTLNITDGMICAGYKDGLRDSCQGDSGGPLLCPFENEKDRYYVGGIVSWGILCGQPRLPGVYSNVRKYIPWILQQMKSKSSTSNKDKDANNFGIGRR